MISCTEFIPAYSELFAYLDNKYGRDEVDRFWKYLFRPDGKGIPLINFVLKEGIKGCFSYWSGSLNEEAADFTMYLNERCGWFMLKMHKCPSKGRLLKLRDETGLIPYKDYCLHCDSYRSAVEKIGLKYIYNFEGVDHASCQVLIYDPKTFDGRVIIDDDTLIMDRRAADNEYFHKDFHSSMNMGIHYLGEKYGEDAVKEYLTVFTENAYKNLLDEIKSEGVLKIAEKIKDTYTKEKAEDAASVEYKNGELSVNVFYCPAVKHLTSTGREVSPWYKYTTETVMQRLAKAAGKEFKMHSYDEKSGAAKYSFK